MFEIIFLSFIQGITEFLPISSSAHLILIPHLLDFSPQGLIVDFGLHIGTLLAIIVYFFKPLLNIVFKEPKKILPLIVATIPISFVGVLFYHTIDQVFRQIDVLAVMLGVFGIVLYLSDRYSKQTKSVVNIKDAFLIGCGQCLALVPGVSRSGITISIARLCGIKRVEAAKFSILLSIPTIGGGALLMLIKLYCNDMMHLVFDIQMITGILLSFVFGYIVIGILMNFIQKHSYLIFAVYRIVLSIILLCL